MKRMKKIFALLMTLAMVMGLGITGFAANKYAESTITVNGLATTGTNSVTYVKILEPDVTVAGGYKFVTGVQIEGETDGTYLTAEDFMKLDVSEQKVALLRDGTLLPSGTTGTISNNIFTATVSAGYYVVNITNTSSSGEPTVTYDNPMILSVQYDKATLNDAGDYDYNVSDIQEDNKVTAKYTTIPVTKTGEDKVNKDETVEVGGTATYEIVTYVPSQATKYLIVDKLTDAAYKQDTVNVTIDGVGSITNDLKSAEKITFITSGLSDADQSMTIDLGDYLSYVGKKVTITYDVTVTGTEVKNTVVPDDGKHTYTPVQEELYTGGIKLTKYIEDGETPMSGASFVVYKEVVEGAETVKYYAQVTEGVLTGWTKNKTEATKLITANETGIITVDGLDLGEYYFEEVEAPEGYSINPEIKKVKVMETNTTKMVEYTPASTTMTDTRLIALPSTGGMGTTLFTIAGCVIMISAAGLFFATRKKAN